LYSVLAEPKMIQDKFIKQEQGKDYRTKINDITLFSFETSTINI